MSCTFFSTSSRAPCHLPATGPSRHRGTGRFFCLSFRFFPPAARTVSDGSGTNGSGIDDSGQVPTSHIRGTRPAPAGPVRHELTGTATGTMPGTMTATVRQFACPGRHGHPGGIRPKNLPSAKAPRFPVLPWGLSPLVTCGDTRSSRMPRQLLRACCGQHNKRRKSR